MIFKTNFDAGSNGVGLTAANSGTSGDAFTAVESTAIYSNEWSRSGALSMRLPSGAVTGYGRWAVGGSARSAALRCYVFMTAAHAGDFFLTRLEVNGANVANVLMTGANALRLRVGTTNVWTAAASFPLGEAVRIETLYEIGTTAAGGRARIAYYLGDSLVPVEDSGWITALSLGGDTGVISSVRFGKSSAGEYAGKAFMDDLALAVTTDYTGSFVGPDAHPPTADAGADQAVTPGATVVLSGTGTDPDGDALTYLWAFAWPTTGAPALTGANTRTPSFVAGPAGSVYALRLTVSDGTASTTDIVNIAVVPSVAGASGRLVFDGTNWK